jgi:hypothetical protein
MQSAREVTHENPNRLACDGSFRRGGKCFMP